MGGIYSKGDTSFLIMCSSFLFPVHIWAVFLGSQFSSVFPHMAPQHRLPRLEKTLKQPPAAPKARQGVANMKKQQRKGGEKNIKK